MMVGQTCNECQYGPRGMNTCKTDGMDKWSLNTPQPCGKPFSKYVARVAYHNSIVKDENDKVK